MSEFHFAGHDLALPNGATNIQATDDATGVYISYDTPQGSADLTWSPGYGWDGEFMAINGVVEYADTDGTFTKEGAYYADARGETGGDLGDGAPVSESDFMLPDFSAGDAGSGGAAVVALSASLMSLSAADHLFTA